MTLQVVHQILSICLIVGSFTSGNVGNFNQKIHSLLAKGNLYIGRHLIVFGNFGLELTANWVILSIFGNYFNIRKLDDLIVISHIYYNFSGRGCDNTKDIVVTFALVTRY